MRRLCLLVCLAVATACAGGREGPQIETFTAAPPEIDAGQQAVLRWQVQNAAVLAIDQGVGDVSQVSQVAVRPSKTTTYTLSAKDATGAEITATALVTVKAPSIKLAFSALPPSAGPGEPFTFKVTVTDLSGQNIFRGYRGTVSFTASTSNATMPAQYAFTADDAGEHQFSASFRDAGRHTITVKDAVATLQATSTPVTVKGLAYTDPAAGTGKVRLVKSASSSAAVMVLDVVAAAPLTAYGAAINLPADPARIAPSATAFEKGALDPGTTPAAAAVVVGTSGPLANVLVAALSQKAAGAGAKPANVAVAAGTVLFSIKLDMKVGAPSGVVFDGAQPGPKFRATLRDREGTEQVASADFAVGKLEVL